MQLSRISTLLVMLVAPSRRSGSETAAVGVPNPKHASTGDVNEAADVAVRVPAKDKAPRRRAGSPNCERSRWSPRRCCVIRLQGPPTAVCHTLALQAYDTIVSYACRGRETTPL